MLGTGSIQGRLAQDIDEDDDEDQDQLGESDSATAMEDDSESIHNTADGSAPTATGDGHGC